MARARVYRHDVRCPDCGSNWMRKDGFSNGKQAYSLRGIAGDATCPMAPIVVPARR